MSAPKPWGKGRHPALQKALRRISAERVVHIRKDRDHVAVLAGKTLIDRNNAQARAVAELAECTLNAQSSDFIV